MMMMMFIPRGWNLFFSGSGTADFHPEALEKARPISPLAEIRQNNSRKNCGKDLNSTPWFAPFYCLREKVGFTEKTAKRHRRGG